MAKCHQALDFSGPRVAGLRCLAIKRAFAQRLPDILYSRDRNMTNRDFYPFESREASSLLLIPLRVRYKLDCAGIRLRLSQWQALTHEEKVQLLRLPVDTAEERGAYKDALIRMVSHLGGAALAEEPVTGEEGWRITQDWPDVVLRQCKGQHLALPPISQWQGLIEADRHALFVLARSNHSQAEFVAAMAVLCGGG